MSRDPPASSPACRPREQTFAVVDPQLSFQTLSPDGSGVAPGAVLAVVSGRMRSILTGERTALNFVQRLSGVATQTAQYVQAVAGLPCQVLDTRKTTPGWRLLEKYAVRCGGGHNHRMGLGDGVLIKDNHLAAVGGGPRPWPRQCGWPARSTARASRWKSRWTTWSNSTRRWRRGPDIVLLDNMKPDLLREAVRRRDATAPAVQLEASGGVTLTTLRAIAETRRGPRQRRRPDAFGRGPRHRPGLPNRCSDEERSLNTRLVGRRILFFDCVDSTNSVAARLAGDPANDGVAVLAAEQTAGRGQHGRRWQCRPGDGVLLSVLLFPPPALRRPAVLTAWAAVAVCETVRQLTGIQARIKWPNDVLLRGRKVCGILIEQGRGAVVGVGLNVRQPAEHFAEAGLPHAASLAQFTDADLDAHSTAEALLRRMDEEYGRLLDGDLTTLETCWKRHVGLLGRDVIAERYDGPTHRGRLLELGFDGMQLEGPGSAALTLPPEMVRYLKAAADEA